MPKTEAFEKNQQKYDNWFKKNRNLYISELNAIKEILPDFDEAIEIGVGTGNYAAPLGIRFGIEPSENMARIARSKGIEVTDAVAENIPFKDESFDLALMVTTLCFVDNPLKAFSETYRILKSGGFFINAFVDKNSKIGKIYQKNKEKSIFYRSAIFYSTDEVVLLLEKAGFKNLVFRQTLFNTAGKIKEPEKITEGYGEGSFIVIRAQKIPGLCFPV